MTARGITAADITGIVGIVPTPSRQGSDSAQAVDTVNLDETVRMVDLIVDSGVDVLLTNGTFGEVATLTYDELLAFNDAVISTVAHRIPVFCGASTLNTRDTISRGKKLMSLGADGLFAGRPMWLPLDDEQVVAYYSALVEAMPDAAFVVYDNTGVFKGKISSEAYGQLAKLPQIVAAKHLGVLPGNDAYKNDLEAVHGSFPLLPTADNWLTSLNAFPGEVPAAWSGDVACGPEPVLVLRDAIAAGAWDDAQVAHDGIVWATDPLFPDGDITKFMPYSIQIDRAEFESAGYITPGPARHPYGTAPSAYLEGGREVGRRWAELRARYAKEPKHVGAGYATSVVDFSDSV
ncbi:MULTISPECIES: dihydrodipicolinate synthase family protein [Micrococcaceae]|uniref:dihydrodipicolinate synthase family protein n=1 Tax=Micrococcaceae TaxID=1268 RepID=UPI001473FB0B|nr:dihydrodipicolinate synthase family protein [Arthrobacter sp. SF27]NMR32345.1 aldolase [Arthrobacter sp. SF27]